MFTILVAEDDLELQELFCMVLQDNGYRALAARDGEEALSILDNTYVDLLISDVMMPRLDGYELTRSLRDAGYQLPILMITPKESLSDKRQGFQSGTDDYKVFSPTHMSPEKTDFNFFAACAPRTLRGFLTS